MTTTRACTTWRRTRTPRWSNFASPATAAKKYSQMEVKICSMLFTEVCHYRKSRILLNSSGDFMKILRKEKGSF